MEWVKLFTTYPDDVAIAAADDAGEVMFTRGLAYCGRAKSGGFIPDSKLQDLTRRPARATRIVVQLTRPTPLGEPGPWQRVDGGYRVRNWDHYQEQFDALEARRQSDRERKRRQRSTTAGSEVTGPSRDVSRDQSRDVTGGEKRREENPAAAAAGDADAAADLAPKLAILRSKLQAHTPLRGLRFDTLTVDQAARLEALVDQHGDDPLVRVAIDTCRHPAPTYVTAFLGTWEALPPPGRPLHVVRPKFCDTHDWVQLTPSGMCTACAGEANAKENR